MKIVGIEIGKDGGWVITDSDRDTHVVRTPEGLWKAVAAIMGSRALPHAEVTEIPQHVRVEAAIDDVGVQLEHETALRYGPLVGRVVGTLAKDMGKTAHRIVRNTRRKGRS